MKSGERGKCPHCLTSVEFVKPTFRSGGYGYDIIWFQKTENIVFYIAECPACSRPILSMEKDNQTILLYPLAPNRPPAPLQVPIQIAQDYNEAALVLPLSPKASAALSRRCLQAILREAGQAKKKDLNDQIDEVMPTLPSHLSKGLDAVRNIGNFAAHPIKSTSTGEIVEVEANEAEWNLDTIEALFDLYYVQPFIFDQKRKALDNKLKQVGKGPLK